MKMIEVLQKVANGEIKKGTWFVLGENSYTFNGNVFRANQAQGGWGIPLSAHDLNKDINLIEPKKFLVKVNIRGLQERFTYLNYDKNSEHVHLHDKYGVSSVQSEFTEDELQSIKPIREFLEDMQGKYELIEEEENE